MMGHKITIQHATIVGRADDWRATLEGSPRTGIGYTWGEALESLVRANMELFGIMELRILDPQREDAALRETVWRSGKTEEED